MDEQDYKAIILYYGREKYFNPMQSKSLEALTKYPANSCFRLYNGFALVLGNRVQEGKIIAFQMKCNFPWDLSVNMEENLEFPKCSLFFPGIRELNPIQSEKEFGMAAVLALMFAHKRCTAVDKEALLALDQRLKEERRQLTTYSAYYAGVFLFLSGKIEKAKEYADKSLKLMRASYDAIVLKSWCELMLGSKNSTQILDAFERAIEADHSLDAQLGKIRYHQRNNDFEKAITVLNHLSIRLPDTNIPLVEKMKIQLASWNWDQTKEMAARILTLEPNNIDALCFKALGFICHEGRYDDGLVQLKQLYSALLKVEPGNADLYFRMAQLFSRVCCRNEEILNCTMGFADKASQIVSSNAEYQSELGYQAILLGRTKEAVKYFRSATKLDDSSMLALCGLTLCQMAESGASEQVQQQIEFLNEIQTTNDNSMLMYMSAKILQNDAGDKAVSLLVEACEVQFKNLKTIPYGPEYLRRFDPDFLLELIAELLRHSPIQSTVVVEQSVAKEMLPIALKHSLNILEAVVKACPGSIKAIYQLAKVEFLCGDQMLAIQTLHKLLNDLDPSYSGAHLLLAQIHIQQEQYQRAAQNLETCLSHNFEIRDNPMYHLLNGIIKKNQMQFEDAKKYFQTALNVSGTNTPANLWAPLSSGHNDTHTLSLADRVTLHLQMIDAFLLTNQPADAIKLMDRTFEEFANTPEEGRVIIANADIALQEGKIQKVLDYLQNIKPGQPYYLQVCFEFDVNLFEVCKSLNYSFYVSIRRQKINWLTCIYIRKRIVFNLHNASRSLLKICLVPIVTLCSAMLICPFKVNLPSSISPIQMATS